MAIGIQFAHHDIGRMTDNGAADTGNVSTQEADSGLLKRGKGLLGLPELLIDELDGLLERSEFDHRVRDLPSPERLQSFVQTANTFLLRDFAPSFSQRRCIWRQCSLHANLDSFEGAEREIGEKLGAGGSAKVDDGLGCVGKPLFSV